MPPKLNPKDRKLVAIGGLVFVLLIVAALMFSSGGQTKGAFPSSYSTASDGAKAAYIFLTDAGYKVRRWEKPLVELPEAAGKTLILAEPEEAPTQEERARLETFISEGGHVIATGTFAGTFLPENGSIPEIFAGTTWKTISALAPSPITRAAPQITLAPQAYWQAYSAAYPLYGDEEHSLVVKYPFGRGEVLWWASATPLANAGIRERGNLEFFLACLGDQKNEILWDEYIHGYRQTLSASIAHSEVRWLFLQLILLALAVVATFSRRSGPICMPVVETRLSPMEFVQTLGGLYERAGTASVAVDICYKRFRYWLTRRLGVAGNTSPDDLASMVHNRWGVTSDTFSGTLRRCESASTDPFLEAPIALHLLQELDRYADQLNLFPATRSQKSRSYDRSKEKV